LINSPFLAYLLKKAMITFSNKYNVGDLVEYVNISYRGEKELLKGKIERIIYTVGEKSDCIRYLINKEQIDENFIKDRAAI